MKFKLLIFSLIAGLTGLLVVSCGRMIANTQITAFEKSIDTLEETYKNLTPEELKMAIEVCENQLKLINNSDYNYTITQRKKIAGLKGRYHRLLVKIELFLIEDEVFGVSGGEVLQYIKGLIVGR